MTEGGSTAGPGSGRRASTRTLVRALVVLALLALGVRFLRGLDWRPVLDGLRRADPLRLAGVVVLCLLLAPLKAQRTRRLLRPFGALSLVELCEWYFASWAADNVLMSQAGLGLRVALIRGRGVPLSTAAAEQALEKVLEGATLLLLLPLAPRALLPAWLSSALARPLVVAGLSAAVVGTLLALLAVARRRPELRYLLAAGEALREPRAVAEVLALSLAMWAIELVMVRLTLDALGLPSTTAGAVLVVVAVNFAAVVPGLPGNLGTFEAVATAALMASGAPAAPALGAAVLYHALHTVPVTLLGAASLRRLRR